jgi:hypothetical protein
VTTFILHRQVMAKNKAELQSDADKYRSAVAAMRTAHTEGRFLDALKEAMDACDYIDGMMQFEKRYEKRDERKDVETIDYVFRYAPLLFDSASLNKLSDLLKSQKRIDKVATADLASELQQAIELMWEAHRLWDVLERESEVRQDQLRSTLGGQQERWRAVAEAWERMRLVQRTPEGGSYRISLVTKMSNTVRGKCRSCGATGKAEMMLFLDKIHCPKCKVSCDFVIISLSPTS